MSSSISTSKKQNLKLENTAESLEEEKPIITPKQEAPQEVVSERMIPHSPNSGEATPKIEKDTIQREPPKADAKNICMKCKKEFFTSDIPDGNQTTQEKDPEVESQQNLFKQTVLIYSREGGSSSPFPSSFNGGRSRNCGFPLFGGRATEMTTTMFSPPIPHSSISWHRVPFNSYQGLYFGRNYGGGGSSSTNSKPLFGSGVTRGVTSMFSPPTPNQFFTGSTSYRTYKPEPIHYSSYGLPNHYTRGVTPMSSPPTPNHFFTGSTSYRTYKPEPIHYSSYGLPNHYNRFNPSFGSSDKSIGGSNNDSRVDSSVGGEVPREMIDLNKPPCYLVDPYLELEGVDKGKAKMELEGDDKDMAMRMKSWGTKKMRTN